MQEEENIIETTKPVVLDEMTVCQTDVEMKNCPPNIRQSVDEDCVCAPDCDANRTVRSDAKKMNDNLLDATNHATVEAREMIMCPAC